MFKTTVRIALSYVEHYMQPLLIYFLDYLHYTNLQFPAISVNIFRSTCIIGVFDTAEHLTCPRSRL